MTRKRNAVGSRFRLRAPFFIFLGLAVLAAGIWAWLYYCETRQPLVELSPNRDVINSKTVFDLKVSDRGRGLRDVAVVARSKDREFTLLEENFSAPVASWEGRFTVQAQGLGDGTLELDVVCRDRSLSHWGQGNIAHVQRTLELDNRPPSVSILSHQHNINLGGSALVIFRPGEKVVRSGVEVGEWFFPGYRDGNDDVLCFFSMPYNADAEKDIPRVVVEDTAGNVQKSGFYYHIRPKEFPHDRINISDSFLSAKMPQFSHLFPETTDNLQLFLKVNRELRAENRATLLELGRDTAPKPLWNNSFIRQPKAATRATFADHRTYFYQGQEIDEQTHLGVDLASVAQDQVQASNAGRVIYADFMGIYGNVVIIDHGCGLQSLYAHLSQMDVTPGQDVDRGQIIGRTGATGLAGGDHLHFGIILSGLPVNPVEWWDDHWLRDNILNKLEQTGKSLG